MATQDNTTFPLAQWFDLSRRISREDRETCEAQMGLYAVKDGLKADGSEWQAAVASLRTAVKQHNAQFPDPLAKLALTPEEKAAIERRRKP